MELSHEKLEDPAPRTVNVDYVNWTHDFLDFIVAQGSSRESRMPFTSHTINAITEVLHGHAYSVRVGDLTFKLPEGARILCYTGKYSLSYWMSPRGLEKLASLLKTPYA
jgi:hypothetical protein